MDFKADLITHSIGPHGQTALTFSLVYPRFILPEVNTHREASRSTVSMRAVPTAKLIDQVRNNPAMPVFWGKNQPGMSAREELSPEEIHKAKIVWRAAANQAADYAESLAAMGAHKQITNRVLETYTWARTVFTICNTKHLYALRRHPDAQPEFKVLADLMYEAEQASKPTPVGYGAWHLPFITHDDWEKADDFCISANYLGSYTEIVKKMSAARCARASYNNHDGSVLDVQTDLDLYEKLVRADIVHASPTEHILSPDSMENGKWLNPNLHGNTKGFIQHRKTIPNEYIK